MEKHWLFVIFPLFVLAVYGNDEKPMDILYKSPTLHNNHVYFAEHFDSDALFKKNWFLSKAKKAQSDGTVVNYNGFWELEQASNNPLPADYGLVLKSKAKHAAISSRLIKKFDFTSPTLVVQYEVTFQDGQECGGAYMKLLSDDGNVVDLTKFHDLTPYTIMFGPDKCGNEHKLHFIFRHKNPRNGTLEEKHAKKPSSLIDEIFSDMKPHLYTLILKSDNTFKVLVDHNIVNEGSLLDDFTPAVNPPAEIDDPFDKEPSDWDDREKIPDPNAKKPDNWDETAPATIPDKSAVMPEGWLQDEPSDIKDPTAEKPADWDVEMDGEWEAPLVPNPVCQSASGCGKWEPPQIANPNFKGKWYAPLIENPDYKGKWTPRKIPNPDYYEDTQPFSHMTPVVAVGFELWSMSSNILFDNIIITDSEEAAIKWAAETFDLKKLYLEKNGDSWLNRLFNYTNEHPWLWAVYIILLLIPTVLAVLFCFGTTIKDKDESDLTRKKKFDESTQDDDEAVESASDITAETIEPAISEEGDIGDVDQYREAGDEDSEENQEQDQQDQQDQDQEDQEEPKGVTELDQPGTEEQNISESTPPRRRIRAD